MTLKKQEAEKEQRKGSIPVCQRATSLDIFSELLLPCSNYHPGAEIASNLSPTNISEHVLVVSKCSCTADQTGNEATYPTSQRGHPQTSIVRTAQFDTILNKPPVIIIQMRVNTCLPVRVPRVIPHLETRITDTSFIQNNIKSGSPGMCSNIRLEFSICTYRLQSNTLPNKPLRAVLYKQSS
jgi:hypothetical protein